MPNYIDNLLTLIGPTDDVTAFIAAAHGRHPPSGDTKGVNTEIGKGEGSPFNFHSLVPLPDEYSKVPYGTETRTANGYDMECATWGIKWGAFSANNQKLAKPIRDPSAATYTFRTAWDGPHKVFMPKVSKRFPSLLFLLSWGGEGPTRGRAAFSTGGKRGGEEPHRKEDYPKWVDEEGYEIPERLAMYNAVQNARLTSHALWCGFTIAHRAAHPFDPSTPPSILADWIQEEGYDNLAAQVRATPADTDPNPLIY